ncbi:hypothetical protein [Catenulispora pinisilvae]|uniref:hypothetical protein n=1 Tax=Catenulispora pinisilvae TaxID=2705253 RepID=UPI001891D8DC|nr:hypothetical protein [Catenulispora pinisilvae]
MYRPRAWTAQAPVHRVRIEKIRAGKGAKVQIRAMDGDEEGMASLVAKTTLKAPWAERDAWKSDDQRYDAAVAASVPALRTTAYQAAAEFIEAIWQRSNIISIGHVRSTRGLLIVKDLPAAQEEFGAELREVLADPLTFTDRFGTLVAPWPAAERWAAQACRTHADAVARYVAAEEAALRDCVVHGRTIASTPGIGAVLTPEDCADTFEDEMAVLAVLRAWCGEQTADRFDELAALRAEVTRLGVIAEEAIEAVRRAGDSRAADALRYRLGLRQAQAVRPDHPRYDDCGP